MKLRHRCAVAGSLALVVSLFTVPPASAADLYPPGEFCPSFAVLGDISGKPGHERNGRDLDVGNGWGVGVFTNADTGQTFTQRSRYYATTSYDPVTNLFHVVIHGRYLIGFYEGEPAPGGIAEEDLTLSVSGRQDITYDVGTGRMIAYTLDGQVLADVCEELAS